MPMKRFDLLFFLDLEIIFSVSNNIEVYMSADSAFS